jgi:hypothetical protein
MWSCKWLSNARVCVEIDASKILVNDIPQQYALIMNLINLQWRLRLRGKMVLLELTSWITSKISFNGRKLLKGIRVLRTVRMVILHLVCVILIVMKMKIQFLLLL